MSQELRGYLKSFSNHRIHIQVAVGGQPAEEGNACFLLCTELVSRKKLEIWCEALGVVRNVAGFGFLAELSEQQRALVLLLGGKVLVLVHASEGVSQITVVDHRIALNIANAALASPIHGAIAEGT